MSRPETGETAAIVAVRGGFDLAARYGEVEDLAACYAAAGARLLGWAALGAATMAEPDLVASAVLSPVTFAEAEAAVLAAATGPHGLVPAAAEWEALAAATTAAIEVVRLTDEQHEAQLWQGLGALVGAGVRALPVADQVGLALAAGAVRLVAFEAAEARLEAWATHHDGGVRDAVAFTGGLAGGVGGLSTVTRFLAGLRGPETPIRTVPVPTRVGDSGTQPHHVADLADHLAQLSDLSDRRHPENDGTIEIQTLTSPDGTVRHVVYLPGTDDMDPFSDDTQVRDMRENLRLIADQPTAYGAGILAAMKNAGIGPDEPVLLAGHSQGGMEAAALLSHGTPYDVTNVVTLGSPTAQVHGFPAESHVLSLEHVGDVVPQLAGAPAPETPAQVTVRFETSIDGLVDNHSFTHYAQGAVAVDASTDPTIRASLATLDGFFAPGQHVSSQMFQITRVR
jgi:hypothetical protein